MVPPPQTRNNNSDIYNAEKVASRNAKKLVHRVCVGCPKTGVPSGVFFMECTRCKANYCSAECQRQHWPNHKEHCVQPSRAEVSQRKALAYLISNPVLCQHIKILTIIHLKLHLLSPEQYAAYVADPFEVEILVNVEPADIHNLFKLYHPSASAETFLSPMKGMFQFLKISTTPAEKMADTAVQRREWQRIVRERNSGTSHSQSQSESAPIWESVTGFINVTMLAMDSLRGARASSVSKCEVNSAFIEYVRNERPFIIPLFRGTGLLIDTPATTVSYIEYINVVIRSDEANEWSLHCKMSRSNKYIYWLAASPMADPTTNLCQPPLARVITKAAAAGFPLDVLYRKPAKEALTLIIEGDRHRVEGRTAIVRMLRTTSTTT